MRKITAIMLALALVLSVLCINTFAATPQALWVNGVDMLADEDHIVACGEGTAVWDRASNILTLTNATVTEQVDIRYDYPGGGWSTSSGNIVCNGGDLNIVLAGENYVDATDKYDGGINVLNGSVTITGEGSLRIDSYNTGINVFKRGITDKCGVTISNTTVYADGENGVGISAYDDLLIENSTVVSGGEQTGIYSDYGYVTIRNSTVEAYANCFIDEDDFYFCDAAIMSYDYDVTIENSLVTATSLCYGISAGGKTVIDNSSFTADVEYFSGIWSGNGIEIKNASSYSGWGLESTEVNLTPGEGNAYEVKMTANYDMDTLSPVKGSPFVKDTTLELTYEYVTITSTTPPLGISTGYIVTGPDTHAIIIGGAFITSYHEYDANGKCICCGYAKPAEELPEAEDTAITAPVESETEEIEVPDTGLAFALAPLAVAMAAVAMKRR